jgi:hypothetical protein
MVVLPSLRVEVGSLPEGVLLPGDPARAARIAERLERPEELAKNREFHSYRGLWKGVPVGVISTGVGAPGAGHLRGGGHSRRRKNPHPRGNSRLPSGPRPGRSSRGSPRCGPR